MAPRTNRTSSAYWKEIPAFYRDLIERHHWKQQPILELVERLAGQAVTKDLFPSTSHEALGLSRFEFYEERLAAPMVYIRYDGGREIFEITYQLGQGHTSSTEDASVIDTVHWRRIVAWLAPAT
jgi:hypothetical protein